MKPTAVIFSECASDNLGDQAISRSLQVLLAPYFDVKAVPFGGGHPGPYIKLSTVQPKASYLRRLIRLVPPKIKARIRWYLLGERKRYAEFCRQSIQDCEFVVVGGGQLIKNNVSLFCDRLLVLEKVIRSQNIHYALVGVGADSKMNKLTWHLVEGIVGNSEFIVVRDNLSKRRIQNNITHNDGCIVLPDLAFALEKSVVRVERETRDVPIAINVMDMTSLLKGMDRVTTIDASNIIESYCEIARSFNDVGSSCKLFTSGSAADWREAENIKSAITSMTGIEVSIFHPGSLDELIGFLSQVRDVIALRMHVGILAYISGCNPVCVNWDDKVHSVWSSIGQEERVIELNDFVDKKSKSLLFEKLSFLSPPSDAALSALANTVRTGLTKQIKRLLSDDQSTGASD